MNRVLLVDDSMFMRRLLRNILAQYEFEIVGEAADGRTAIEQYSLLKPDIVTMDITMPDISGIETLREIKKLDPKAKIVMVSSMGQDKMVTEAVLAGAASFILKPFKENVVVGVLTRVLSEPVNAFAKSKP